MLPPDNSYPDSPQQPPDMNQSAMQPSQPPSTARSPAPRKRRLWSWITDVLVVLLIIVIVTVANAISNNNRTANSVMPVTRANRIGVLTRPASATRALTHVSLGHKTGESVPLDGWTIIVNSAKTRTGSSFNTPQNPGDVFLWIDVTLYNNTGRTQTISGLGMFVLKDMAGHLYNPSIDTDAPASPDGQLANKGKARGVLVWEISRAAKIVELDFTPGVTSTDLVAWTLTIEE